MANTIQIKRSQVTAAPASLAEGELAYSEVSENLFIGTSGSTQQVIGGKAFTDKLNGIAPGANNYSHPTQAAINVDTSGATIIDSINVNTAGHVTAVATRTLTPANIGAAPDDYSLPLEDLTNVTISSPAGGDILVYSSTNSRWEDKRPEDAGLVQSFVTLGTVNIDTDPGALAPGYHFQPVAADATLARGYPVQAAGVLSTVAGLAGSDGVQVYHSDNGQIHVRYNDGGTWGGWAELWTGNDFQPTDFAVSGHNHDATYLNQSSNLSDLPNKATARSNLGVYSTTETNTQITNAVNAVIDAAPGALDTLNELAAALGDDANFATNVNASIATKLTKTSNLSDLPNKATARSNLGLGSLATLSALDGGTF